MTMKKFTSTFVLLALCVPPGLYAQRIPIKPKVNPSAVAKQLPRLQTGGFVKPGATSDLTHAVARQATVSATAAAALPNTPEPPALIITEGNSRAPRGAGKAVSMATPKEIVPLKTKDEVLVLPTDMQNLIGTLTQNRWKRIQNADGEKVNFVETIFSGVPTYSRLATARYLHTLGVDAETIVKASGQYPSIFNEFLPEVAKSEELLNYLYHNNLCNDETLPILLQHTQPYQINKFLTESICEQEFEQADNLIANYGADINVAFQRFFNKTYSAIYSEEELLAGLQFFADRNVDFNQVFDKDEYPDARTAAHQAAYNGEFAVIPFLKEHGADLNAPDAEGNTPLHLAVKSPFESRFVVFEALYRAGADPTIKNNAGFDVWQQIQEELSYTASWSARYQHLKEMQALLKPLQPKTKYFRHPVAF